MIRNLLAFLDFILYILFLSEFLVNPPFFKIIQDSNYCFSKHKGAASED